MGLIEYSSGQSYLHKMDPRVKILAMLFFSIIVFIVKNTYVVLGMFLLFVAFWSVARLPWGGLLKFAKVVSGIMGFIVLLQVVFYPGTTYLLGPIPQNIFLIGGMGFKLEGLLFGILLAFRLMALMVLMPMVIMTTEIHLFSLGLVRLGLPYKIAYMSSTALNMIPTFQDEIGVIMDAQKMRGMNVFEEGTKMQKLKAYPALVVPLVIGAMRRAQMMGVAMDTRAFGAHKTRHYIDSIQMRKVDWITAAIVTLIGAAFLALNFVL